MKDYLNERASDEPGCDLHRSDRRGLAFLPGDPAMRTFSLLGLAFIHLLGSADRNGRSDCQEKLNAPPAAVKGP